MSGHFPDHFSALAEGYARHRPGYPAALFDWLARQAPGRGLALWTYDLLAIDPAVDAVFGRFYRDAVGPWWPPERHHVETGYRELPFPFPELAPPALEMTAEWRLADLLGYLGTWSAVKRCREATGRDPLAGVAGPLREAWGEPETPRPVRWPLHLRVGMA